MSIYFLIMVAYVVLLIATRPLSRHRSASRGSTAAAGAGTARLRELMRFVRQS